MQPRRPTSSVASVASIASVKMVRALAALVCPGIIACSGDGSTVVEQTSSVSSPSFVWNGSGWADLSSDPIPVCWVNPGDTSDDVRAAIRSAIEREYHGRTNVRFSGFTACGPGDEKRLMVRARLETKTTAQNSHPGGLSWVGPNEAPLTGESTATMWFGAPSSWSTTTWLQNATITAALHEFGHAVGLVHEHSRPDAPACDRGEAPIKSDSLKVSVGPYDSASIMNYCRTDSAPRLSDGDIAGLAILVPLVLDGSTSARSAAIARRPLPQSLRLVHRPSASAAAELQVDGSFFTPATTAELDGQGVSASLEAPSRLVVVPPQGALQGDGPFTLVLRNEWGTSPPFVFRFNGTP